MMILIIVYFLLIMIALSYSFPKSTIMNNKYYSLLFVLVLSGLSMYVIYVTDINYTDRSAYTRIFNTSQSLGFLEHLNSSRHEPLYILFNNIISYFTENVMIFYLLLHLLFLSVMVIGLYKIKGIYYVGYVLFILINAFFYYGYTLNGLRQGISISLIILVIGYLIRDKTLKATIVSLLSILFHYSAFPIIIMIILLRKFQKYFKIKYLIILYLLTSLLFLFDLQQFLVGSLGTTYIEQYTSDTLIDHYGETNNINFLIFNSFFLILFYYFSIRYFKKNEIYQFLYKSYIILSIFFLLFGFVAFANRVAIYSWFLIPLLLGFYLANTQNNLMKGLILVSILIIGILTGIPERFLLLE